MSGEGERETGDSISVGSPNGSDVSERSCHQPSERSTDLDQVEGKIAAESTQVQGSDRTRTEKVQLALSKYSAEAEIRDHERSDVSDVRAHMAAHQPTQLKNVHEGNLGPKALANDERGEAPTLEVPVRVEMTVGLDEEHHVRGHSVGETPSAQRAPRGLEANVTYGGDCFRGSVASLTRDLATMLVEITEQRTSQCHREWFPARINNWKWFRWNLDDQSRKRGSLEK